MHAPVQTQQSKSNHLFFGLSGSFSETCQLFERKSNQSVTCTDNAQQTSGHETWNLNRKKTCLVNCHYWQSTWLENTHPRVNNLRNTCKLSPVMLMSTAWAGTLYGQWDPCCWLREWRGHHGTQSKLCWAFPGHSLQHRDPQKTSTQQNDIWTGNINISRDHFKQHRAIKEIKQQVNHDDRMIFLCLYHQPDTEAHSAALETFGLLQELHSPFLCSHWDVWELARRSEKPTAAH